MSTTIYTPIYQLEQDCSQAMTPREMVAWILLSLLTLILVTEMIITVIYKYKRNRKARDNVGQAPAYEMDGNPCYETTEVKETNNIEMNIYESV